MSYSAKSLEETGLEESTDGLSALPHALIGAVLRQLCSGSDEAASLLRLASCSRSLHDAVVGCEDVWRELCERRGWRTSEVAVSQFALFIARRSRLCRDCGAPTVYVFTLLNRRLCERCEAASPRYRLVTQAQVMEQFQITTGQLAVLPFRDLKGVVAPQLERQLRAAGQARFFLFAAVEELAEALAREEARQRRRRGEPQLQFDDDDEALPLQRGEEALASTDNGSTCSEGGADRRREKQTSEERKQTRRAHKQATKSANRERRAAKSAARSCPAASPAELHSERFWLTHTSRSPSATPPGQAARSKGSTGGRGRRSWDSGMSAPSARAKVEDALGAFGISGLDLSL